MNDFATRHTSEPRLQAPVAQGPRGIAPARVEGSVTPADLPPPGTTRWVVSRKAAVVAGVKSGLLSLDEALQRYGISLDEFLCWKRLLDDFGVKGLRVTRIKEYRTQGHSGVDSHSVPDASPAGPDAAPCAA